jgi:hypothetical protein
MAETPETNKPDLRNGFPIRDLRDGSMTSGHAHTTALPKSVFGSNLDQVQFS